MPIRGLIAVFSGIVVFILCEAFVTEALGIPSDNTGLFILSRTLYAVAGLAVIYLVGQGKRHQYKQCATTNIQAKQ